MNRSRIAIAETESDIKRCHAVMRELRPQFENTETFVRRVQEQAPEGYRLAFLEVDGEVSAVAGYRFLKSLFSGDFLYVDDLVTKARNRSLGHGGQLLDWLANQARDRGCESLELDSGVQRFDAHRFYFQKRMNISSYHFRLQLRPKEPNEKSKSLD